MINSERVERFITKSGYEYKSDTTSIKIKANYTFGLFLRKIYLINENGDCLYSFKQEDFIKKLLYNLVYLFYRNTTIPVYILYKNNVKIGGTGYYKDDILPIKTTEFNINLVLINSKKNYIIKLVEDDSVIAEITKSRLRYGKKNIYNVICNNWGYDKELLLLLTALCDVVFFPEWPLLKWSAIEYDLTMEIK